MFHPHASGDAGARVDVGGPPRYVYVRERDAFRHRGRVRADVFPWPKASPTPRAPHPRRGGEIAGSSR